MDFLLMLVFQRGIVETNALTGAQICYTDKGVKTCCYNYHAVGYRCEACPVGRYGYECNSTCPKGFFGRFCKGECKCEPSECDLQIGCLVAEDTWSITNKVLKEQTTVKDISSSGTSIPISDGLTTVFKYQHLQNTNQNIDSNSSIDVTVPIVLSIVVLAIISFLFFFFLRRKVLARKNKEQNERMVKMTSVDMCHIYNEINTSKKAPESCGSRKCKLNLEPSTSSGKNERIEVKDQINIIVTSQKSRGSYASLIERQNETNEYDTLKREKESTCLAKTKKEAKNNRQKRNRTNRNE